MTVPGLGLALDLKFENSIWTLSLVSLQGPGDVKKSQSHRAGKCATYRRRHESREGNHEINHMALRSKHNKTVISQAVTATLNPIGTDTHYRSNKVRFHFVRNSHTLLSF